MKKLVILGAGGHAKVVAECAQAMQMFSSILALDDRYSDLKNLLDIPIQGPLAHWTELCTPDVQAFVAIGDNMLRAQWMATLAKHGIIFATIIHPTSWVSPSATLAEGVLVAPLVAINAMAKIGFGSIINTGAVVEHDCVVGSGAHIAPHATLAGGVTVARLAWVGMGAHILGGVTIGEEVVIGAGSVVREAVAAKQTVVGIPARLLQSP